MTILTNRMKSLRSDHYGSSLKLWMPGDDVSGDTLASRVGGVTVTDDATAEYTEPHAVTIISSLGVAGSNIDSLQLPKKGLILAVVKGQATVALGTMTIGDESSTPGVGFLLGESSANFRTGIESPIQLTRATSAASGDYISMALAWDASTITYYFGEDKADMASADSGVITAAQTAELPAPFTDKFRISAVNPLGIFGIALFDFTNDGLPSDVLAGINWMQAEWHAGRKVIYDAWKDLT